MLVFDSLNHRLDIPWETLEGMVKGVSAIDMSQMNITTLEEAEQFIYNYGFDMTNAGDREEVQKIQQEAIGFIRRKFLSGETDWTSLEEEILPMDVPPHLMDTLDARHLVVVASTGSNLDQRWACAILKVMHTICHINNAVLFRYFETAREKILSRFKRAIHETPEGEIYFGSGEQLRLSLVGFEVKDEKTRDSMIVKLLSKRENVAEEIFDMIGVRIITHTRAEAVLALELLRRNKLVIFPNLIPSRSRNSLIDFDEFKTQYQEVLDEYEWGVNSLKDTLEMIEHISPQSAEHTAFNPKNASSLSTYRSIHLTERQLIRFKQPGTHEEIRFFFPYEIQIVDKANYLQSLSGSSAHSLYKQNQLIQARRRVLGPLFVALKKLGKASFTPAAEPEAV